VISQTLLKRFDLYGPRYTSYPTADRFGMGVGSDEFERALIAARDRLTSIYVHVPFCKSLCYYCACNKIVSKSPQVADEYLDALDREIDLVSAKTNRLPVSQLAFGGGTPNFLSIPQFVRLLHSIAAKFDLRRDREQSVEIDPRYLPDDYLLSLRELGFNRVSFGVQDFDEHVQKIIHRFQSFEQTKRAVHDARSAGFPSVSFDLVYGLPTQSRQTFAKTLERVLSLDPDRLALFNYAHIPERFKAQRRIPNDSLPTVEERVSLFLYARERLVDAGYVAVGLDHFAKPSDSLAQALRTGALRRNFQGYAVHDAEQLIGLGVSAITQFEDLYAQNCTQLDAYKMRLEQGKFATQRGIALTLDDRIRAKIIERIMCHGALDWREIENEFNLSAKSYFTHEWAQLQEMQTAGIVEIDDATLRVNESGRLLLRAVAMVFDAHRGRSVPPVDGATPVRFSRVV
jgi:oxygen-independent coproporphyrinogen III oxidase